MNSDNEFSSMPFNSHEIVGENKPIVSPNRDMIKYISSINHANRLDITRYLRASTDSLYSYSVLKIELLLIFQLESIIKTNLDYLLLFFHPFDIAYRLCIKVNTP